MLKSNTPPTRLTVYIFFTGSSTQGEKPNKNKKKKKKKSSTKKQAAGEWQGQEGEGTGKDSIISSALEDDSCTGRSGGNKSEVADNHDETNPENPPTLQEQVRALLAHQQGTSIETADPTIDVSEEMHDRFPYGAVK